MVNNNHVHTFVLEGNLTIQNASNLKQKLLHELEKGTTIKVEWGPVESIDVAGIQLIHSMVKTADAQEKELKLTFPLPQNVEELIFAGGFGYLPWATED